MNIEPNVDISVDNGDEKQKNVKAGTVKDVDITFFSEDDGIMIKPYKSS